MLLNVILAQAPNVVRKPICPTFVHDDTTRLIILSVSIPILLYMYVLIFRYFCAKN